MDFLKKLFNLNKNKSKRRHIRDVKVGEYIRVEWDKIKGGMGYMKCLNNDPKTKKIFLEITWTDPKNEQYKEIERIIFKYKDEIFKNFHLINPITESEEDNNDDNNIALLQKRINEAIEKEQYEIANELQKKIDKLLKK